MHCRSIPITTRVLTGANRLVLDESGYARALVAKAEELEITVLAVTDHNHVGGVDGIRSEAQMRGIHVFPGFELSSTEGIHVLCLYPPATAEDELGRYLGEFGIRATKPSSSLCDKSFADLLALVRDQGGISIAAHVENDNGLFRVLQGQPRIQAWQDENLYAIQIAGSVQDLPVDVRRIVQNRDPKYIRAYAPEADLAIAVVNASDVVSSEDLAKPAATCWIKMSEVSIEGLRQAFLDPESRIRLHSQPPPEERSELVAMGWQGGFLDGAAFHFNSNLNVLVGGRGAGKSTVIESLRHVLGLEPLGEEARATHSGNTPKRAPKRHEGVTPRTLSSTKPSGLPDRTDNPESFRRARCEDRQRAERHGGRCVPWRRGLRPARDLGAHQEPGEADPVAWAFRREG